MTDKTTLTTGQDTPATTPETPEPEAASTAVTPAEATNTDTTTAEHMIPKSRFDQINTELKELRAKQAAAETARQEAEEAQLKEQQKYRQLWEKSEAKRKEAEVAQKAMELQMLRRQVAAEKKLPAALADRLVGETLDDIVADADKLLESLPTAAAPNLEGGAGAGKRSQGNTPSEAQIREQAARVGVSADYMAAQYGVTLSSTRRAK